MPTISGIYVRPDRLSGLFDVRNNLRGIAKQGYCRPTVSEFLSSYIVYDYAWCTLEPVWDSNDEEVLDHSDELVTVPI